MVPHSIPNIVVIRPVSSVSESEQPQLQEQTISMEGLELPLPQLDSFQRAQLRFLGRPFPSHLRLGGWGAVRFIVARFRFYNGWDHPPFSFLSVRRSYRWVHFCIVSLLCHPR